MSYKLTKEDLENGRDFWLWTADNPGKDKEAWPEYKERLEEYMSDCPFCEGYSCRKCPLTLKGMECCEDKNDNPFDIWIDYIEFGIGTVEKATQAALTIANVFQEEIDKLDGGAK